MVHDQDFPCCELLTFNGAAVQSLRQLRQMAMAGTEIQPGWMHRSMHEDA